MPFARNLGITTTIAVSAIVASAVETKSAWSQDAWSQAATTTFAIQIQSVATPTTLKLPDGSATAAPISTGLIVVSAKQNVLFQTGVPTAESGLQQLAEDGTPVPLIHKLIRSRLKDVEFIAPGLHYRIKATPGDRFHFAVMFVQSNDLFYAFDATGLPLFDGQGKPISGDVTKYVSLWDAGTEVNQTPGLGTDQAPRQVQPDVGEKEYEPVVLADQRSGGFTFPAVADVIKVTVTPVNE
jgi:hypothetical protein